MENEEIDRIIEDMDLTEEAKLHKEELKKECKEFWEYFKKIHPIQWQNIKRGRPQFEGVPNHEIPKDMKGKLRFEL